MAVIGLYGIWVACALTGRRARRPIGCPPTSPKVLFRRARRLPGSCRAWRQDGDGLCHWWQGGEPSIGTAAAGAALISPIVGRGLDATVEAVALIRRACRKKEHVRRLIL